MPLKDCGFHPQRCGGQGIAVSHLHGVVLPDIIKHGSTPRRYAPVRLVVVPSDKLENWRHANKIGCDNPLMPEYSPSMWLCHLTKQHFGHAHKLIADGGRSAFNRGMLPAKLTDDDIEGQRVQEHRSSGDGR